MPATADPAAIREILETDRSWAVYALADLAPEYSPHARWHIASNGRPALLLIYRAFRPPVLFAHGTVQDLEPLLAEIADEPEFYLSVRPDFVRLLRTAGYEVHPEKRMWRMLADREWFTPPEHDAVRLGPADHEALTHLYEDGNAAGEAPPFFDLAMLQSGTYFGIREGGLLAAAAGTHVFAPQEGVAGIGNVYTRRDCRGRGLGLRVTAAVTANLLRMGLRTVALNVDENNGAAIRVYERLGFRRYCEYREGIARAVH